MAYFEPLYRYIPVFVTKETLKLSQQKINGYQKYVFVLVWVPVAVFVYCKGGHLAFSAVFNKKWWKFLFCNSSTSHQCTEFFAGDVTTNNRYRRVVSARSITRPRDRALNGKIKSCHPWDELRQLMKQTWSTFKSFDFKSPKGKITWLKH